MEQLARDIVRIIFDNLVKTQIASFFTSLLGGGGGGALGFGVPGGQIGPPLPPGASFQGNIFGGGQLRPFIQGGIFSGGVNTEPSLFNFNGGVGSIPEFGQPEAILPLDRDSRGNLGVRTSGGGGGSPVNIQNLNINARNPDDGLRRSGRQIQGSVRRKFGQ